MLYSDKDIRCEIDTGRVRISPYEESMVQPSSIDLRLASSFRVMTRRAVVIDPSVCQEELTELVQNDWDEPFVLHPGDFVLGATLETVGLPDDIAARLEGKSSLGRLGLVVHSTAGFIDPGFVGTITLELTNVSGLPMKLWPGMKIGQLCLIKMTSPAEFPYGHVRNGSKYWGQVRPTASRAHMDF